MKNIKNLRVAVIPTESDKNINQGSTVKAILECTETRLYQLPDYFQAQNDEELPTMYWSFLIDMENKVDLTGIDIYDNVFN